ncbi:hypothetical protein H7347_04785 [Corynebacterium sp. zg-331]|uniref:DUF6912 family protein n=1 Tax=unclassified Corynebacterium TaxID=2624378 RepID=UPI00128E5615|nr:MULTISPECIES: hypothetical protein [unclassified Corynebacterium]MBC3185891.1 hypothetical protein [Corynebacterium sp. zg-331]MPV52382.1 hypothetical protein [Corynebacterium sp. zg331]
MRVYIPATVSTLRGLNESRVVTARSGWAFAVTPALRAFYEQGDEEEIAHAAFQDAAEASLRLLAVGDEEEFPHRRVVISADVPEGHVTPSPENGESVVRLNPPQINLVDVAAMHVDVPESEGATARAIAAIDAADLGDEDAGLIVGDALDNFLAWYDPSELPVLVELL